MSRSMGSQPQPLKTRRRGELLWIFEVDGEWLMGTAQKGATNERASSEGEDEPEMSHFSSKFPLVDEDVGA